MCVNGQWSTTPECYYLQPEVAPQCPENFTDTGSFCYQLSPQSPFPPTCPYKDVLPFDSYKHVVLEPVWMPVHRNTTNRLGFMQWTEATSLYKTDFNGTYAYSGHIQGKDCLVYHNTSYIVAVSCDEEHKGVCAYKKLDQLSNQLCGGIYNCRQGDFDPKSKCYCVGKQSLLHSKAEFLKPYQNVIYGLLTDEVCAIGLEKTSNGSYIWTNSLREVDYTFWSPNVTFDNSHIYGAATSSGWILTEQETSCYLFETEVQNVEPYLSLDLDLDGNTFSLKVGNPRGLKAFDEGVWVYCFTDAYWSNLVYRFPILQRVTASEDFILYQFDAYMYGAGDYWCDSFRYSDMKLVTTPVVRASSSDTIQLEFVAVLQIQYPEGINPLGYDFLQFFHNSVLSKLRRAPYTFRIMKILSLDEEQRQVGVNLHCSGPISESSNEDDEFTNVKIYITEALETFQDVQANLTEFSNSYFCIGETTGNLTWEKASAGNFETPVQLCFRNGSLLVRWCIANFINGAKWSEVEDCDIAEASAITAQLLVYRNTDDLAQVCELTKQYGKFNPLDVYVVADMFSDRASLDQSIFAEVVNNIMYIDKTVLIQSQVEMKATDRFLLILDNLIAFDASSSSSSSSSNFMLKCSKLSEMSGIIVQKDGDNLLISELKGNVSLEEILNLESLESAMWIDPVWCSSIVPTTDIVIMVMHNDALYNEVESKNVSRIFRVSVADVPIDCNSTSVKILHKMEPEENVERFCSRWNYNVDTNWGFWEKISVSRNFSSFMFCEYTDVKFSMAITSHTDKSNDDQDVTIDLIEVLESNDTVSDIIKRVHEITKRYHEFRSFDVYLLGKVLQKVSQDDDIDLTLLAYIINNVHKIKRGVLSASQNKTSATDMLLHYVDVILQNHKRQSPVKIVTDNFIIIIDDVQDTSFSGLALLYENQTFDTQVLVGDVDNDDLKGMEHLDCAVVLSSELKAAMDEDYKVIVTVFSNDGLFNEKTSNSQVVSSVFGVILPKIKTYSGPVSVFHKVGIENGEKNCVHWYYDKPSNVTGSWRKDSDGKITEDLVRCEFWHTTHFALLLLDEDQYQNESSVLDTLTIVNCSISLFGLCGVILTAILFKKWRMNTGNQILLNFVGVVILQIGMFYISEFVYQDSDDYLACVTIGAILHYAMVSEFCWMLIIALLQFKRFVVVLGGVPSRILLKVCFCGWILPVVPVVCLLVFDKESYVQARVGLCYPSGLGLYLAVWLPISIIITVNFIIFVCILYSVVCRRCEQVASGCDNEDKYHRRLAVLLFFLLGLTWTFGFLAELAFGEVFVYLFCFTATLQGYVIFLFFILFNQNTRHLYLIAFKNCFGRKLKVNYSVD
jgi:hypothetical protein